MKEDDEMDEEILSVATQSEYRYECMRILRKDVKLSSREAYAYMMDGWAYPKAVADDWGITLDELDKIYERAKKKIRATGKTDKEIFGKYYFISTTFVS